MEYMEGRKGGSRTHVIRVPRPDVQGIRERMGLSQSEFARRFGFARASVRNWEQGRREPEGPARILLAVIEDNPRAVQKTLSKFTSGEAGSTTAHAARAGKAARGFGY
jgi:putative transcriptional regulator